MSAYICGFYAAGTSKLELVVTIVINGWHPWTIVTKCSILYVAVILNSPPYLQFLKKEFFKLMAIFQVFKKGSFLRKHFKRLLQKSLLFDVFDVGSPSRVFWIKDVSKILEKKMITNYRWWTVISIEF